jgi:aspartate racemase
VSRAARTVGVIGGLGPAATLDFLARVLAATPAARDQDHVRLIIDNNPAVPDRQAALAGTGPSPGPALAAMAAGLERAGADFLVMPCNTAHAFQAEIEAATRLPLVGLIDETAAAVASSGVGTVGLLGTRGCLEANLYQNALAARGVRALAPAGEALDALMAVVRAVKAGDVGADRRAQMRAIALELAAGADALVVACTEIPLALEPAGLPVPVVDATDVLVERTVALARGAPWPERL